jgi:hypothetical protein
VLFIHGRCGGRSLSSYLFRKKEKIGCVESFC